MEINSRIAALRGLFDQYSIDAYIVGTADPHQSEYPPTYWGTREWISGFTGSAGTVIVTKDHAGLWTDARYFLQAEQELAGSEMKMHKLVVQTQAEYLDWLGNSLKQGQVVACNFLCFSMAQIISFEKILKDKGIQLKHVGDLFSKIWHARPSLSLDPIYEHDIKFAGKSREEKLESVRLDMITKNATKYIVTALDEIAYVLNLRGSDVAFNPVFVAYLIIDIKNAVLFVNKNKFSDDLIKKLFDANVIIKDYNEITNHISSFDNSENVWIDSSILNAELAAILTNTKSFSSASCIMLQKSLKNEIEMNHIREVMAKDGAALVKAFMWLENELKEGRNPTEYEYAQIIAASRAKMPHYIGESFSAIVGYNANGAIIHYRPDEKNSAKIKNDGILLIDSGGQYLDGTTDITRTISLSPPNNDVKKHYTAVLMGNIALAQCIFPHGTKGVQLDILARQFLWSQGLNYGHGTGHGVGFFMNVHEPPQGIVTVWNQRGSSDMLPGSLTSNEPGFYVEGSHGIRIENLILTIPHSETTFGKFYSFESVTLFPIDTSLIDYSVFSTPYKNWLNEYHQRVFEKISPWLNQEEVLWLKEKCKMLD